MRRRVFGTLSVLIVALMLVPQLSAIPGGIGSSGNAGCSCHAGGDDGSTTVVVDGLPEVFNASESYPFTVTLLNDNPRYGDGDPAKGWSGVQGGFRIVVEGGGSVTTIDPTLSQVMDGGLTHSESGNKFRSWDFEFVAPASDEAIEAVFEALARSRAAALAKAAGPLGAG